MNELSRQKLRVIFTPVLTTTKEALNKRQPKSHSKLPVNGKRSLSMKSLNTNRGSVDRPRNSEEVQPLPLLSDLGNIQFKKKLLRYNIPFPKLCSEAFGLVRCYGSITHKGLCKKTNEDRISIIPGVRQGQIWFAVYDGHGGSQCADFVDKELPKNYTKSHESTSTSLKKSISAVESAFLKRAYENRNHSGSCALVAIIQKNLVTIANVGDSRCITSQGIGSSLLQNTQDHKPSLFSERERIIKSGGIIYETKACMKTVHRVMPGRLSVSRTIGDLQAKVPEYKGNPNVVISTPDLSTMVIDSSVDFVLIASDGLFDVIPNKEILEIIWRQKVPHQEVQEFVGRCLQVLLVQAFDRQGSDNISIVMIVPHQEPVPVQEPLGGRIAKTLSLKDFRQLSRGSFKRLQVLKEKTHLRE